MLCFSSDLFIDELMVMSFVQTSTKNNLTEPTNQKTNPIQNCQTQTKNPPQTTPQKNPNRTKQPKKPQPKQNIITVAK